MSSLDSRIRAIWRPKAHAERLSAAVQFLQSEEWEALPKSKEERSSLILNRAIALAAQDLTLDEQRAALFVFNVGQLARLLDLENNELISATFAAIRSSDHATRSMGRLLLWNTSIYQRTGEGDFSVAGSYLSHVGREKLGEIPHEFWALLFDLDPDAAFKFTYLHRLTQQEEEHPKERKAIAEQWKPLSTSILKDEPNAKAIIKRMAESELWYARMYAIAMMKPTLASKYYNEAILERLRMDPSSIVATYAEDVLSRTERFREARAVTTKPAG